MKLSKRSSFSLISPAKINLFFLVLNKRSDNFHEIASLYQAVSLFDEITIEPADADRFTCSNKNLENAANSVVAALNLFRKQFQINLKVKIHLEKKIPVEAGLGGGSSNAATVLWALNKLFRDGKDEKNLIVLSKKLGSDVPFFFSSGSAICTGRGDIVNDVKVPLIEGWILKPFFGISTSKVYANVKNTKVNQNYQTLLKEFQLRNFHFINDLQVSAEIVDPRILAIQKQYPSAIMTGSGSCFFTLKKPRQVDLIEKIFPFKGVFRTPSQWYSIN